MLLRDRLPGLQMLPETEDRIFANSRESLGKMDSSELRLEAKASYHLLRV